MSDTLLEDLKSFLDSSPTSWHCTREVQKRLVEKGFVPLQEKEAFWNLKPGGKYCVIRGGSIAAFLLPQTHPPSRLVMLAAHTDSPALKVKPHPDIYEKGMHFLGVEVYGGPILHSWLNRDLALAGRVFFSNEEEAVQETLLFFKDIPLMIPELAIHFQREVNEKGPLVNAQEHLLPLLSLSHQKEHTPTPLEQLLIQRIPSCKTLLSFDLFLVPLQPACFLGVQHEMLASYRIDNLTSVHAATCALTHVENTSSALPLAIFWDHEEVGSHSWEGASSSFLDDLLLRIKKFSHPMDDEAFLAFKHRSLCLSLDMAHAFHPQHAQKHDPIHAPILGGGIVFKSNANLNYASSSYSLSNALSLCQKAHLAHQTFVMRSDMRCGSTVGPIVAAKTGIPTIDLGCPQLSMHSCRELLATKDYLDLYTFLTHSLTHT